MVRVIDVQNTIYLNKKGLYCSPFLLVKLAFWGKCHDHLIIFPGERIMVGYPIFITNRCTGIECCFKQEGWYIQIGHFYFINHFAVLYSFPLPPGNPLTFPPVSAILNLIPVFPFADGIIDKTGLSQRFGVDGNHSSTPSQDLAVLP